MRAIQRIVPHLPGFGFAVLGIGLLLGVVPAASFGATAVQKETPFKRPVGSKLRECAFQLKLPEAIANHGDGVKLVNKVGGTGLHLEITDLHAPGGGAFTGPKWATVLGELKRGGKVVGSFTAKRFTTGFGSFAGTCEIVAKLADTMGQDIADWLANPMQDSLLGDAK
ncbi:MAG: hypothetical protein QNK05_22845 [Myxococcota bacterium]|nr:hypothetical protein [Myxococcota bacterium]